MATSDTSSNSQAVGSSPKQPQQIEHLSPLAVGDQKLNRHLGYFSGTLMNGIAFFITLEVLYELTCSP